MSLLVFGLLCVSAEGTLSLLRRQGTQEHVTQQTHEESADRPVVQITGSAKPMPALGFGTCCRNSSTGPALINSTKIYLRLGGRHIDTAQMYGNHRDIKIAIAESQIPRDALWVTSKVNTNGVVTDRVGAIKAVHDSLEELGMKYLDLMLIHGAWDNDQHQRAAVWRGLIAAKKAGVVRNIGVSNYNREQIEQLEKDTGVRPAVNQIEYHPWVPNATKALYWWCKSKDIAVTAYGSLGGNTNRAANNAVLTNVASKHAASNAQVLLHWALDQGAAVIPGATSEEHIRENLFMKDFHLDADDLSTIDKAEKPETFRRWKSCKSGCAN